MSWPPSGQRRRPAARSESWDTSIIAALARGGAAARDNAVTTKTTRRDVVMTRAWVGTRASAVPVGCLVVGLLALGCASPAEMSDSADGISGSASEMAEYLMTLDLGTVHFPTSGSADAQRYCEQAVSGLPTLAYHDAAILFREAQRVDPDFAMAYWGEAMTRTT